MGSVLTEQLLGERINQQEVGKYLVEELLCKVSSFEKRKDLGPRADMDNILEGCEDIVPDDDVLARDIIKAVLEVKDFGEGGCSIGVFVLITTTDCLDVYA